jgi:hypothetical protein
MYRGRPEKVMDIPVLDFAGDLFNMFALRGQ